MTARVLALVLAAAVFSSCAITPSPIATTTPAPPSPTSPVVAPPPTSPAPVPTQVAAAAIVCPPNGIKTVYIGALSCDEAIAAALAALPQGHERVLKADFVYALPCPLNARCAAAIERIDRGWVVITSEGGGLEVVSVVKAANGTISTGEPLPYSPSG